MLGVINDSPRYFSHSGTRLADLHFGQGPTGDMYLDEQAQQYDLSGN
jgi:hypothetical protein